jgi:hypothetical protein
LPGRSCRPDTFTMQNTMQQYEARDDDDHRMMMMMRGPVHSLQCSSLCSVVTTVSLPEMYA